MLNNFSSLGLTNLKLSDCVTEKSATVWSDHSSFTTSYFGLYIYKKSQFAIFLHTMKLYEEDTLCGYVSQQPAVSGHKTQMTSHPLKIAATAGI